MFKLVFIILIFLPTSLLAEVEVWCFSEGRQSWTKDEGSNYVSVEDHFKFIITDESILIDSIFFGDGITYLTRDKSLEDEITYFASILDEDDYSKLELDVSINRVTGSGTIDRIYSGGTEKREDGKYYLLSKNDIRIHVNWKMKCKKDKPDLMF